MRTFTPVSSVHPLAEEKQRNFHPQTCVCDPLEGRAKKKQEVLKLVQHSIRDT